MHSTAYLKTFQCTENNRNACNGQINKFASVTIVHTWLILRCSQALFDIPSRGSIYEYGCRCGAW